MNYELIDWFNKSQLNFIGIKEYNRLVLRVCDDNNH